MGLESPADVRPHHIYRIDDGGKVGSLRELYPSVYKGSILDGTAPEETMKLWERAGKWTAPVSA